MSLNKKDQQHIIVIESYEGYCEFLSDEPEERKSMRGLGLPLKKIAEHLDCRITILHWNEWYRFEREHMKVSTPATQPISHANFDDTDDIFRSDRVKLVPIPARDPDYGLSFRERGLSPRSHGLINDSGLLFFASYCLNKELQVFYHKDPFQLVILPMWGGLGYVSQMARAVQSPNLIDVPFVVVVTDTSANRQSANQEGIWTRQAIVRRQTEDISLALADLALVYGKRGDTIAHAGRLPEAFPPVHVPRFVEESLLAKIEQASKNYTNAHKSVEFFLYEPQQIDSGVLAALDAVDLLVKSGVKLKRPVISAGPPMVFAPMRPRGFVDYWSSRGFVREMIQEQQWEWKREYPCRSEQVFPVRLYPSLFDHLPNVWAELARGSLVLLSQASAEGLAHGEVLPEEVLIQGNPTPEKLANHMQKIIESDTKKLDEVRQKLCKYIINAYRGDRQQYLLGETSIALEKLLQSPPKPQDLSRVALMFFDRRVPLHTHAQIDKPPLLPKLGTGTKKGTLSAVVTCYEMGSMIKESIQSVWASERKPDEVILIDDGSQGQETISCIQELEADARAKGLPLKVIRQRNQGLAKARNTGLEAASGEFVSFLDGDDIVEPPFYQVALKLIERYPRLGGVSAWATIFGAHVPDGFWNAPQSEFPFLFIENSIIVPCLMRTEAIKNLGGYDIRQRYNYEDWELGIRILASRWPIITIPMHLMKYRIRLDSLYRSMTDTQNQVMRELLLNTHRNTVSHFAVEIAMQLEHQVKKLVYPDSNLSVPYRSVNHTVPLRRMFFQTTRKFISHYINKLNLY